MEASVLDLRYRMNEVLKALERREQVSVLYHGKVKGVIMPAGEKGVEKVSEHPFFGSKRSETRAVAEEARELRKGRYDAL